MMSDAPDASPSPAPEDVQDKTPAPAAPAKAKPSDVRAAEKIAKLQEQLKLVRDFQRKATRKKHAIVGKAIMAAAESDPALKQRMLEALRKHVTSPAELAEIADLLL